MLMIYELENPEKSPQTVIKPYEDNYSIFAVLKDAQGNVIYQSPLSFPTDITFLLSQFTEKASVESVTALDQTKATTQGGVLSFSGSSHDKYWGIPAVVIDKNGTLFYLSLLHRQKTIFELIGKQLPFLYTAMGYLLILYHNCKPISAETRYRTNRKSITKPERFYCRCLPRAKSAACSHTCQQ